nr:hypothetical protein [Tanacetum cinerariifolium]
MIDVVDLIQLLVIAFYLCSWLRFARYVLGCVLLDMFLVAFSLKYDIMADVNAPSGQAPAMAPPVRTDEGIVPRNRAFTASSTILSIYIQLHTANIREASYYQEYQANMAKHRRIWESQCMDASKEDDDDCYNLAWIQGCINEFWKVLGRFGLRKSRLGQKGFSAHVSTSSGSGGLIRRIQLMDMAY